MLLISGDTTCIIKGGGRQGGGLLSADLFVLVLRALGGSPCHGLHVNTAAIQGFVEPPALAFMNLTHTGLLKEPPRDSDTGCSPTCVWALAPVISSAARRLSVHLK